MRGRSARRLSSGASRSFVLTGCAGSPWRGSSLRMPIRTVCYLPLHFRLEARRSVHMLSFIGSAALSSSGDMPMLDSDSPPLPSSNTLVGPPLKPHRKEQPSPQAALLFLRDPKSGLFGTEMPEDDVPIKPQARRHRGLPTRNRARPGGRSQVNT
jgi:hypothetical protein